MKRVWTLLLALSMVLSLAACGSPEEKLQKQLDQGMALLESGSYEEAIAAFEKAMELSPQDVKAMLCRAQAVLQSGDGKAAMDAFQQVLDLDPANAEAWLGKAEAILQDGDRLGALKLLRDACSQMPDSALIGNRLAELGYEMWSNLLPEDAQAVFEEAAAAAPDSAFVYLGRAMVALQKIYMQPEIQADADFTPIVEDLRKALELDGSLLDAKLHLGELLTTRSYRDRNVKEMEEALALLNDVLAVNPEDEVCIMNKVMILTRLKDDEENFAQAEAIYQKILEKNPADPTGWLGMVDLAIRRGQYEKAEELIAQAEQAGGAAYLASIQAGIQAGEYVDNSGRIRKKIAYDENGNVLWYQEHSYTLDSEVAVSYDAEGKETGRAEAKWDPVNQTFLKNFYADYETGVYIAQLNTEIREDGTRVTTTTEIKSGSVLNEETLFPAKDNQQITEFRNAEGTLLWMSTADLDADGKKTQVLTQEYEGDKVVRYRSVRYEYDEQGRILKEIYEGGDDLEHFVTYSHTDYLYEGDRLVSIKQYDSKGNVYAESNF